MIKFNFKDITFEVKEVDGLYDLNDLRKQVDSLEVLKSTFNSTQNMAQWTRYLTENKITEYQLKSTRGKGAKTLTNKLGLIAYCAWLNEGFEIALQKAFLAIAEGRDSDARDIVGQSMIDMEMVKRVEERWNKYVKWCYENFREVNTMYGGNLTRMVVASATGVAKVSNVKGKVDEGYIQKLASQGHGAAILAVNATLELIGNSLRTTMFKEQMKTREGKKIVYSTLKEILNWSDEDF